MIIRVQVNSIFAKQMVRGLLGKEFQFQMYELCSTELTGHLADYMFPFVYVSCNIIMFQNLGDSPQVLADLASGKHPFSEVRTSS